MNTKLHDKIVIIGLLFLGIITNMLGQANPSFDQNYLLNVAQSDEFNVSGPYWNLDFSKWATFNVKIGKAWGNGGMEANFISFDGNNMVFKIDYDTFLDTTGLFSAYIQSKQFNYSYGYYEARIKLPGAYVGGQPESHCFWPAFWSYYQESVPGPVPNTTCWIVLDEIDIVEPACIVYDKGDEITCGWHDEIGNCQRAKIGHKRFEPNTNPLFTEFHIYAVEWLPERLVFYFDNIPYFYTYFDPTVPNNKQKVVMGQQIGYCQNSPPPNNGCISPGLEALLPLFTYWDYFHYYELKYDCKTDVFVNNQSEFDTYDFQVHHSVNIGNSINSITMTPNDNMVIRASESIEIQGEFTVPLGAELFLIPTPCDKL